MVALLPAAFAAASLLYTRRLSRQSTTKRTRGPCLMASASGPGASGSHRGSSGGSGDVDRGDAGDSEPWRALQQRVRAVREKTVARDRRCAQNWRSGAHTTTVVGVAPIDDFVRRVDLDGSVLACGTAKGAVCLFNLQTLARAAHFNANIGQTTAVCIQGAFLASVGASDLTICVWDVSAYRKSFQWHTVREEHTASREGLQLPPPLFTLRGHNDIVTCVKIDAFGKRLFSASVDGTVKIWDLSSGELLGTIACGEAVLSIVVTARSYIIVGCVSGMVRTFLADKGTQLFSFKCHTTSVFSIFFHDETQTLSTGDASGRVKLWSFNDGLCIGSFHKHSGAIMSIQHDATKVVTASRDGSLTVSAIQSRKRLFSIIGFTKYISSCTFDGARLIADGTDNVIACHRFDTK